MSWSWSEISFTFPKPQDLVIYTSVNHYKLLYVIIQVCHQLKSCIWALISCISFQSYMWLWLPLLIMFAKEYGNLLLRLEHYGLNDPMHWFVVLSLSTCSCFSYYVHVKPCMIHFWVSIEVTSVIPCLDLSFSSVDYLITCKSIKRCSRQLLSSCAFFRILQPLSQQVACSYRRTLHSRWDPSLFQFDYYFRRK